MEETQPNKSASATRKRRSSILKSHRAPRTPFSELEFNVATPTDTAKSRRVSFSRRTGVAEFATNEATTTWKNFYEEHNKSLESSSNDSGANPSRSVAHVGRRIFDEQFEEVEVVDLIGSVDPRNQTLQSMTFNTQQLLTLECTNDPKLPHSQNMELSELTDHQSKLFGDDLAVSMTGKMKDDIDVNFSMMQSIGGRDDLDDIQRDLDMAKNNVVCAGPTRGREISEYIEVDLNMTSHVAMANESDDMSITDTIASPKVQNVSKNVSVHDKSKDWIADKENIVFNPYVAPRESDNFALNEEPEQVLVFDGKKVTLQSEKTAQIELESHYRDTLLPKKSTETTQRKTIVLNVNDDLPNFVDSNLSRNQSFLPAMDSKYCMVEAQDFPMKHSSKIEVVTKTQTIVYEPDTGNLSITQAVPSTILVNADAEVNKRKTIVFNADEGNLSITQAIPTSIKMNTEKRKTIVYNDDTGNLSITEAVPSNIIGPDNSPTELKKTLIYDSQSGNISVTQVVPASEMVNDYKVETKPKTDSSDSDDMSLTRTLSSYTIKPCSSTNSWDLSMTNVVPDNLLLTNEECADGRRKTVVFDDDAVDISITQAIPNALITNESFKPRRRTVLFENEEADMSVTQAIPKNIIMEEGEDRGHTIMFDDGADLSMTQAIPATFLSNIEKTIERDEPINVGDESVLHSKIKTEDVSDVSKELTPDEVSPKKEDKRKTILFNMDSEGADMSVTEAIPNMNRIIQDQLQILPEDSLGFSKPDEVSPKMEDKRKTILFNMDNEGADMSVTEAIPNMKGIVQDQLQTSRPEDFLSSSKPGEVSPKKEDTRKTILFNMDNEGADMSVTEAIPNMKEIVQDQLQTLPEDSLGNKSSTKRSNYSVLEPIEENMLTTNLPENSETESKRKTILDSGADMSFTEAVPRMNSIIQAKGLVFDDTVGDKSKGNISMSKPVPSMLDVLSTQDNEKSVKEDMYKTLPVQGVFVYHATNEVMDSMTKIEIKEEDSETDNTPQVKEETHYEIAKVEDRTITLSEKLPIVDSKEKSILDDLLDMSDASVDNLKHTQPAIEFHEDTKENLNASRKSDNVIVHSVESTYATSHAPEKSSGCNSPTDAEPVLRLELTTEPSLVMDLKSKLTKLKNSLKEEVEISPKNRHFEEVVSPDIHNDSNGSVRRPKTFREANDTNELLDMLSSFTDREDATEDDCKNKSKVTVKNRLTMDSKAEVPERRRLSQIAKRQSIVISREDLLTNISMAQAALQTSPMDMDDSAESLVSFNDSTNTFQKSGRLSSEVVKTLKFDDDILFDNACDKKISPLKKTAFGESSYMQDDDEKNKSKVIPSYLKDVTDSLKELMNDLVKPTRDVLPFESEGIQKSVSTRSALVQANLCTSSQIDLDGESSFSDRPESGYLYSATSLETESSSKPVRSPAEKPLEPFVKLSHTPSIPPHPGVIPFDPSNPLNNVVLPPPEFAEVHKYSPKRDFNVERVSVEYSKNDLLNSRADAVVETLSQESESKPPSLNRSVEAFSVNVKEIEVNTSITMKDNEELLDVASSLTLVDDALAQSAFDLPPDSKTTVPETEKLYNYTMNIPDGNKSLKLDKEESKLDMQPASIAEGTSTEFGAESIFSKELDETKNRRKKEKTPKRSALKRDKEHASPRGAAKLPRVCPDLSSTDTDQASRGRVEKKSPKIKRKRERILTVHQLMTEYNIDSEFERSVTSDEPMDKGRSLPTVRRQEPQSECESECTPSEEVESNPSDVDDTVNVVAKIDMLPFMGSGECEWESCCGDTWAFRLLRGRVRLCVRLAHRHDNALRTRVRADTPVTHVGVKVVGEESSDPIVSLCVHYLCVALESVWADATRAGDAPERLRRSAGEARAAKRWARALAAARSRLAATVTHDGLITVKVANMSLRSVWEASFSLELCDCDGCTRPAAGPVRLRAVISDCPPPLPALRRALLPQPRDWGHAPRTLWKIFRFLKNRTKNDDLLL